MLLEEDDEFQGWIIGQGRLLNSILGWVTHKFVVIVIATGLSTALWGGGGGGGGG